MIEKYNICRLLSNICKDSGFGMFIAIYNDIEKRWTYFVGQFTAKNPTDRIHCNNINGICIDYIFQNDSTYFQNDIVNNQKIITYIQTNLETNKVDIDFDFKVVAFK